MTEDTKPSGASLSINDIAAAVQIINAATKRGAFDAKEALEVGMVYARLSQFIESTKAAKSTATSTEEEKK